MIDDEFHVGMGLHKLSEPPQLVLKSAYRSNVRLFDVAPNYLSGRAEHELGQFLSETRLEATIFSKVGYVWQFSNGIDTDILHDVEIIDRQSFDNAYILRQIKRSKNIILKDLRPIDVLFLHNPESYLAKAETSFEDFFLEKFDLLEFAVSEGLIKQYGVATWELARSPKLWHELGTFLIRHGASYPGFRWLQSPISLVNLDLAVRLLDPDDTTHALSATGIKVVGSSPLAGGLLMRIIDDDVNRWIDRNYTLFQNLIRMIGSLPAVHVVLCSVSSSSNASQLHRYQTWSLMDQQECRRLINEFL